MTRALDTLAAQHVLGWRREGVGAHTRPAHRPSIDFPGQIINDFGNKGPHDFLVDSDGKRVAFCGCDSTTELPTFSADIAAAWQLVEAIKGKFSVYDFALVDRGDCWECGALWLGDEAGFTDPRAIAPTAPLAITIAALRACAVPDAEIEAARRESSGE